jgi:hypothetical protein
MLEFISIRVKKKYRKENNLEILGVYELITDILLIIF